MLLPLILAAQNPGQKPGNNSRLKLIQSPKPVKSAVIDGGLTRWVDERITFPAQAIEMGVTGTVTVKFVVDTAGKVSWVRPLIEPCNTLLYLELKRVLSESSGWTPALDNEDKPVSSAYTFAYDFTKKADANAIATMTVAKSAVAPHFIQSGQQKKIETFCKWVDDSYEVPKELKKMDYDYHVTLSFSVGKNAQIRDIEVKGCDDAALTKNLTDLIGQSKWSAAMINGKAQDYFVSVDMALSGDKKGKIEDISFVEQREPTFPGGMDRFLDWLDANLPDIYIANKFSSSVGMLFTVERDGSLSNIKIVGNDQSFQDKASQTMQRCPKWIPGIRYGKTARYPYAYTLTLREIEL